MATAETLKFDIQGMHCDACVRRVTNALSKVPGVAVGQVAVGSATLTYDPAQTTPSAIAETVREIGFEVAA